MTKGFKWEVEILYSFSDLRMTVEQLNRDQNPEGTWEIVEIVTEKTDYTNIFILIKRKLYG